MNVFEIDPNRLDEEWLKQPLLFRKWATKLADAKRSHEEAKANLEVVKAETAKRIRKNPDKYDLDKTTEGAINEAVLTHPKYTKAFKAVIEARHSMDIVQALVSTLDHRKRALENLVELHGQDYFSTPKPKRAGREVSEAIQKRAARRREKDTEDE